MNHLDLSDYTILVAEDNEQNYQLISISLRTTNARIIWVQNGQEAVDACLANEQIDLILMDGMMPLLTGYEAASEIRKIRPSLPIIILTAYISPSSIREAVTSGCNDFMGKPIGVPELHGIIKKWLAIDTNQY